MKRVLIVANGIGFNDDGPGISGGDVRWIEIAKRWVKDGFEVYVLTTTAGIELANRLGLEAEFFRFPVKPSYSITSYIQRAIRSFRPSVPLSEFEGIIYASTEHWYDVLPAAKLRLRSPDSKFVVVSHWVAPISRQGTTTLHSFLFFLNQQAGYFITKRHADIVLAVSESTAQAVRDLGVNPEKIRAVSAGVHIDMIDHIKNNVTNRQRYQAVFMKRFDVTKGIYDVLRIWDTVTDVYPDARLALIGGASDQKRKKVERICMEKGIMDNVEILGSIYDHESKYRALVNSELFLLPSYEENWAIVIGEAMAAGLPVVCYDIPEIRPIWGRHVQWTPCGDESAFANEIISLLEDDTRRRRISKRAYQFVKQYSWERVAKNELQEIIHPDRP